jgi:hypothetical protein
MSEHPDGRGGSAEPLEPLPTPFPAGIKASPVRRERSVDGTSWNSKGTRTLQQVTLNPQLLEKERDLY